MEMTYTFHQLAGIADALLAAIGKRRVIAFHGNMGAGKTTLIHALCQCLNVKDTVSSPTFSIINEYSFREQGTEKKIYHIDLYRLRDEPEAIQAGVEDCLYSDHTCFVEWPEKIPGLLPPESLHVYIESLDAETRKLRIGDN